MDDTLAGLKPKPMAELLPELRGILFKDSMRTLTARKQPRQTIVNTRTNEKVLKPLTMAEMRADLLSLRMQSPGRPTAATTSKKMNWNSSVKVNKTVSHTAKGKMKDNPVRKALNFLPPKPKPVSNIRSTMAPDSPKFTRPEFRPKKPVTALQAHNNVRISGINNIAETPVVSKSFKMTLADKENVSSLANKAGIKKFLAPPQPLIKKKVIPVIPDTPMSKESWNSSCDSSFLQIEKEIYDTEEKVKAIAEEPTLENIAAGTLPASTPFKEYRNVQEFFNHSSEMENSALYNDNTIMSFGKHTDTQENNKREESVIVSLCELLDKASVTNGKMSTELEDLLQLEAHTEEQLKWTDINISAWNKIKQSQLTSLQYVRKLIKDKKTCETGDKTLTHNKETPKIIITEHFSPENKTVVSTSKPCSVIKSCSKSPSYKIPKKNLCLRKKVIFKSMPNITSEQITPVKANNMGNKALSMYLKMKENMNFLTTPVAKREFHVPDTPAVTSNNLQKQLDKLYGEN